jgi:hypothetical protein
MSGVSISQDLSKPVSTELAKYKLGSVGEQEVSREEGGTEPADGYRFLYANGNADHHLWTGFLIHKRTISVNKRVEVVSDRMSYLIIRGRWCDIIALNVHATTEDK